MFLFYFELSTKVEIFIWKFSFGADTLKCFFLFIHTQIQMMRSMCIEQDFFSFEFHIRTTFFLFGCPTNVHVHTVNLIMKWMCIEMFVFYFDLSTKSWNVHSENSVQNCSHTLNDMINTIKLYHTYKIKWSMCFFYWEVSEHLLKIFRLTAKFWRTILPLGNFFFHKKHIHQKCDVFFRCKKSF